MADAPKILGTDTLRSAYPKLNSAIDNANEALTTVGSAKSTADAAKSTADTALSNSENTQTQLDTIVINGDSSVEAAQARVDVGGNTFTTLKARLDSSDAQLADIAINIRLFGAKGDGVTNDAPSIQSALNYARDNGGGEVYVPNGAYNITSTLFIFSNTRLRLSKKAVIKRGANINAMLLNGTQGVGLYNGDSDIEVSGGIWDGKKDDFSSNVTIIGFGHAKNITIKNTIIKNAYGWHHVELNAVKNSRVLNCDFRDFDNVTPNKEMLQLDLMKSNGEFPWFGLYDNTPCDNILIEGCNFINGCRGIGSHSSVAGYKHTNINIKDCHFETMREEAIVGQDYENVIVSNNTFSDCFNGIVMKAILNSCEGFVIDSNVMDNMKPTNGNSRGIYMAGVNGGVSLLNGNITNNKIANVGRHGLGVDFCSKWNVAGNTVSYCGYGGIWLYGTTRSNVQCNVSTGNGKVDSERADIAIGGTSPTNEIIVTGNTTDKIDVMEPSQKVIFTNNIVTTRLRTTSNDTANLVKKFNNFVSGSWVV